MSRKAGKGKSKRGPTPRKAPPPAAPAVQPTAGPTGLGEGAARALSAAARAAGTAAATPDQEPGRAAPATAAPATAAPATAAPAPPQPRPAAVAPRPPGPRVPVEVATWSCNAIEGVEPQGVGMTHWVDVPEQGDPRRVRVRFTGRRVDGDGEPATFSREIVVGPVPAGAGRIAVTGRATSVPAGEYEVQAVTLDERGAPDPSAPTGAGRGHTSYGPVIRALAPGVRLFAWPSLVLTGTVAGTVVQGLLAGQRGVPGGRLLALTLLACVLGTVGAKAYYLGTHRGEGAGRIGPGMSIQGFVLVLFATLILGTLVLDLRLGDALDVSTPGLLTGMAIGRLGCWFGGCCVGRPTASRWGLWSSDRVLGVRRIPVQFVESAMTAALAVATGGLLAGGALDRGGTTFVLGLAAYTLGRQVLFPLRDIPRQTRWGRPAVLTVTALAVALAVGLDVAG